MRLVGRDRIERFVRKHSDSGSSLRRWVQVVEANDFRQFAELKETFASADYVRPYTLFNISGNKYRLVALVDYGLRMVSVEAVVKHEEYDEQSWRAR